MMGGWNGWSWWGWVLMSLSMVGFWGLVVWGLVAVVRSMGEGRRSGPSDPGRVLEERFARGELTVDEYLSARSLLDAQP